MQRTKSLGAALNPTTASQPLAFAPVSNAPSTFYRQHHTVEAPAIDEREFRPGWRVKTRLMLLAEYGRVDRYQLEAAAVFKGWCEAIGRQRTSGWLALRVDGGRHPDGFIAPQQIEAARRLHEASVALGRDRTRLLVWSIVDDLPWARLAQRLGISKPTAAARVLEAIEALRLWRGGHEVRSVNRPRIEPGRW